MKRIPILITSAALAGSLVLGAPASADPRFEVLVAGDPIQSGASGGYGQPVHYNFTGCLIDGVPGYFGQFIHWTAGPERPDEHGESLADSTGNFSFDAEIPFTTEAMALDADFYCASAPVTSPDDPAIQWMSPTVAFTIDAAPAGAQPQAARASIATGAATPARVLGAEGAPLAVRALAAPANGPSVTVTVDQDALPQVDRMGIVGPKMAALKDRVDDRVAATNAVENFVRRLLRMRAVEPTNRDFVEASFQETHGRMPSTAVMRSYIARLDDGDLKVTVLEDIALRARPASHWNR